MKKRGFTVFELLVTIMFVSFFLITITLIVKCSSYVTGGTVANDIGNGIKEVREASK